MPRYTYHCNTCEETFNVTHSMSEEYESRDECGDKCELEKIPSNLIVLSNTTVVDNKKVGQVVNKSIEESRQELKEEKRKLRNKVYEDD